MKNDIWSNSIVNYSKYLWCAKSNMHHYHCHSVWGMRIESQIEIVGVWQFFNVSCWVDASHSCVWIEYNWALFIWCLRNPSAHHTNQQQFHLCKCCFAVIIGCNREKSLAHENCHFVELCDICMGQSLFLTIYASGGNWMRVGQCDMANIIFNAGKSHFGYLIVIRIDITSAHIRSLFSMFSRT